MLVIVVIGVGMIFLDDGVRLSVLDKRLGLFVVVADVECVLARSARAWEMWEWLTRLRLWVSVLPSVERTSAWIGATLTVEDPSESPTGRVSIVGLAPMSTRASLSSGLRETMTVFG